MALNNKLLSIVICHTKPGLRIKCRTFLSPFLNVLSCHRGAHTQKITNNIELISEDNYKLVPDMKTMKLNRPSDKPVCIMLNWLKSTPKQTRKYEKLYLDEGCDVLRVFCKPWQLMWPKKGTQVIGRDLIKLMAANEGSYVVHGFSVGGYVWSEALVHAMEHKELYQPALDRVDAQVWDSVADITEISIGVPLALFPNNRLVQRTMSLLINMYLRAFYTLGTQHYERACRMYYATPCRAPALFLLSSADPVGNEHRIRRAFNMWLDMGIKCTWKCWPDSQHVRHYVSYPDEYAALVRTHLRHNVRARSQHFERERLQARL